MEKSMIFFQHTIKLNKKNFESIFFQKSEEEISEYLNDLIQKNTNEDHGITNFIKEKFISYALTSDKSQTELTNIGVKIFNMDKDFLKTYSKINQIKNIISVPNEEHAILYTLSREDFLTFIRLYENKEISIHTSGALKSIFERLSKWDLLLPEIYTR